jgi:hypothetical protein
MTLDSNKISKPTRANRSNTLVTAGWHHHVLPDRSDSAHGSLRAFRLPIPDGLSLSLSLSLPLYLYLSISIPLPLSLSLSVSLTLTSILPGVLSFSYTCALLTITHSTRGLITRDDSRQDYAATIIKFRLYPDMITDSTCCYQNSNLGKFKS